MRRASASADFTQDTPPRAWEITLPFGSPAIGTRRLAASQPVVALAACSLSRTARVQNRKFERARGGEG
jgi:hypothetical protein